MLFMFNTFLSWCYETSVFGTADRSSLKQRLEHVTGIRGARLDQIILIRVQLRNVPRYTDDTLNLSVRPRETEQSN